MKKFDYKRLSEIKKDKTESELNYADLLSTTEWKEFRDEIVKRDEWNCQKCGERSNELAWELKGSTPADIYVRRATKTEKKISDEEVIYSSKPVTLNAHHKYYIKNKNPWEYNPNALITVCSKCHTKIHETEKILIYDNDKLENPKIAQKCSKCSGTGYLDQFHYFMSGICFDCNGKGTLE